MMNGTREAIELNNQKTNFFYVDNGLSVVAVDEASGRVAGSLCAKDSDPDVGCCTVCDLMCMMCKLFCGKTKQLMDVTVTLSTKLLEPIEAETKKIMKE